MPSSNLTKRLKAIGSKYAKAITRDANKTPGKPKHVKVSSHSQVNNDVVEIISEGSSDRGDARAYEYGSGTRSRSTRKSRFQQGAKGKILIKPKNKNVLAFDWQTIHGPLPVGGKKLIGRSTTETDPRTGGYKIMFRYVEHPGVQAASGGKGYLAPAISKNRKPMNAEIRKETKEEIRAIFRRKFK